MEDYMNRTKKFGINAFKRLDRDSEGNIVHLSQCFFWLTDKQVELLTGDDCTRYDNLMEDLRCLLHEAKNEFNG